MFISHRYRFIFIRTEKTASSSLTAALRRALPDERQLHSTRPPKWSEYSPVHHGGFKRALPQIFGLHVHARACQIRAAVGENVWNSYFKFAVERNPWDRQVSLYAHRKRRDDPNAPLQFDKDMRSWLYRATEYTRLHNWQIYTENDCLIVDRVLKYETLGEELDALWSQLGVREAVSLPRARGGYRDNQESYREHYSDFTRDLIARWYAREIEHFGYEF